jgi:hypothetical protein
VLSYATRYIEEDWFPFTLQKLPERMGSSTTMRR